MLSSPEEACWRWAVSRESDQDGTTESALPLFLCFDRKVIVLHYLLQGELISLWTGDFKPSAAGLVSGVTERYLQH